MYPRCVCMAPPDARSRTCTSCWYDARAWNKALTPLRAFPNWQNQGNCPSVRHNTCILRRTTRAMMVLKRLLSLLKDGILLGQVRYYVEQSHFHSANGGYETPSKA